MALESRWYNRRYRPGYRVLVMDPATSGITWERVEAMLNDPACGLKALPATVYNAPWGIEESPTTQAAHIESCKRETLLLAEAAMLAPRTTPNVTLRS